MDASLPEVPLAIDHGSESILEPFTGLSVSEALDQWLSGAVLKDSVRLSYRRTYDRHILPAIGRQEIININPDQVDRVLKPVPMNKTMLQVAGVLSGLLSWAADNGHIAVNPYSRSSAKRLIRLAELQVEPRDFVDITWSAHQVAEFIRAEDDPMYQDLWWMYATTGVRRGEALGLTSTSVESLEHGWVWISENVTSIAGKMTIEPRPKSWQRRKAYVGPQLQERLILSCSASKSRSGYVFPLPKSRGREPLKPDTTTRVFNRLARRLGLPHIGGPHGLRRTFATLADHMGTRERVVQQALGHAPNMTQRYQKVSEAELVALAERMESLILS